MSETSTAPVRTRTPRKKKKNQLPIGLLVLVLMIAVGVLLFLPPARRLTLFGATADGGGPDGKWACGRAIGRAGFVQALAPENGCRAEWQLARNGWARIAPCASTTSAPKPWPAHRMAH